MTGVVPSGKVFPCLAKGGYIRTLNFRKQTSAAYQTFQTKVFSRLAPFVTKLVPQTLSVLPGRPIAGTGTHRASLTMVAVVLLGSFGNSLVSRSHVGNGVLLTDPELSGAIAESVDPYTTGVDENAEAVALALDAQNTSFIGGVASLPEEYQHQVQKGETLSSIATSYGVTVATVLEANGIAAQDAGKVRPGTILTVPAQITSTDQTWLAIANEEQRRAAEAQARAKAASQRGTRLALQRARADFGGSAGGFILPIRHNGISRGISWFHAGIDYRADRGTPVVAGMDGKVIEIGWGRGYGMTILVDHGGGLSSRYGHLSGYAVGLGNYVSQGQVIGYSGNTGWSTGPHLHFEVRRGGRVVNPF